MRWSTRHVSRPTPQTAYEHAWAIRDRLGYRDFTVAEHELRAYVGSRVWTSLDTRRTLFDRAVVWLVKNRVLLPGITVLARVVAEVRSGELALVHGAVDEAVPAQLRRQLVELLAVPDGQVFSTLDRWRTRPKDRTGKAQKQALERASQIKALGAGELDVTGVPPVKLAELARYGMAAKAPTLRDLAHPRRVPTLLATVRHLETSSVDDALVLFDVLMATNLLAKADRQGQAEKARGLPQAPHGRRDHGQGDGRGYGHREGTRLLRHGHVVVVVGELVVWCRSHSHTGEHAVLLMPRSRTDLTILLQPGTLVLSAALRPYSDPGGARPKGLSGTYSQSRPQGPS